MEYLANLVMTVAGDVWTTIVHNWPYLLLSVLVASLVQVYLKPDQLSAWLRRRTWVAVLAAVALGALTPFCSCGTTAVVLGALASAVPWAPIVAFMASSPLTSPEEFVLSVGLFGPSFAITFFVAAIAVGLLGGAAAWWLEGHGHLDGQSRMPAPTQGGAQGCCPEAEAPRAQGSGGVRTLTVVQPQAPTVTRAARLRLLVTALWQNTRKLAVYFLAFAAIGYLLIRIIPTGAITGLLGDGNPVWSVPLAAVLGIPVYLNSDGSLPLVASFMNGGMSPGAAIAFLITGAGTSIGSISGMLVIARWRVVALIVATLFVTAITTGWLSVLWL
ncbi:MAG TPA: permease [Propionicimonas sp.]|uniref:permease n=1 Tax=Propionicimonas sp. TaxID=1955623 RepID=UPI002F3E2A6B